MDNEIKKLLKQRAKETFKVFESDCEEMDIQPIMLIGFKRDFPDMFFALNNQGKNAMDTLELLRDIVRHIENSLS